MSLFGYIGIMGAFLFLLFGCEAKKEEERVCFQVMVPHAANRGTPFYMIAKSSEMEEFYMDDYQKIASQLFSVSKEQEEVVKKALFPGVTETIQLPISEVGKPVAVYFLFTHPAEEWKVVFDDPSCKHFKVLLGENGIESTHSF